MTKAQLIAELNVDKFDVVNFNRLRDFLENLINSIPDPTPPPAPVVPQYISIFGLTAGTGNGGASDYVATVAVGAPVPFPRDGAISGSSLFRNNDSSIMVDAEGDYKIEWVVNMDEPAQLQVTIGGTAVPQSTQSRTTGTSQLTNSVILSLVPGDIIEITNPLGNATALTVTPADGNLTHAIAQTLTVTKM